MDHPNANHERGGGKGLSPYSFVLSGQNLIDGGFTLAVLTNLAIQILRLGSTKKTHSVKLYIYIYLSIYSSTYLSIYINIYLYIYMRVCVTISIYLFINNA